MNIVIIGAGAIGGTIAAHLINNNKYNIELVCKHRDFYEAIENNGLRVEGIGRNLITYPDTVIDISQISDKPDIVFLATKAQDVTEAAKAVLPFLQDDTTVVSLQNGICEDQIAEIIGRNRTIGCVVGWGATMLGAGRMELTSKGNFVIGELNGETTHRMFVLRSILTEIFPTTISSNIYGDLFSKLIINSCITTLGAITGLNLGDMLNMHVGRSIFLRIITEAVAVAQKSELKLEKIANKLDLYSLAVNQQDVKTKFPISLIKKHLIIYLIGIRYRKLKSSSLQSLERGRPTEIEYLNGYIVKKADEFNVRVPINNKLISMIKDIENNKLKIEPENIYKIL